MAFTKSKGRFGSRIISQVGKGAPPLDGLPESEQFAKYIELASNIDWKRGADIWLGSILLDGGKLVTNRAPVALAAQRVKERLGLANMQAAKDVQTVTVTA
jgi:hypothetical protein